MLRPERVDVERFCLSLVLFVGLFGPFKDCLVVGFDERRNEPGAVVEFEAHRVIKETERDRSRPVVQVEIEAGLDDGNEVLSHYWISQHYLHYVCCKN